MHPQKLDTFGGAYHLEHHRLMWNDVKFEPGDMIITISADGIEPASVTVSAKKP